MIADLNVPSNVRLSWLGTEKLRTKLTASAFASGGVLGGRFPFALIDVAHNLPFVQAYGVLNDVLEQLRDEGHFQCKSRFLGPLVKASQHSLPWQDFAFIDGGVAKRNDVAHRAKILKRTECWKYIKAIKVELCAWKVI